MTPETPPPPSVEPGGRDNRKGGRPKGDKGKGNPSLEDVSALIAAVMVGGHRYEYRLRYRRGSWKRKTSSTRIVQTERAAQRYVSRLYAQTKPDLAPLTELVVEKRVVGPWAHEVTLIGEDGES
jgi:hypothetical protein